MRHCFDRVWMDFLLPQQWMTIELNEIKARYIKLRGVIPAGTRSPLRRAAGGGGGGSGNDSFDSSHRASDEEGLDDGDSDVDEEVDYSDDDDDEANQPPWSKELRGSHHHSSSGRGLGNIPRLPLSKAPGQDQEGVNNNKVRENRLISPPLPSYPKAREGALLFIGCLHRLHGGCGCPIQVGNGETPRVPVYIRLAARENFTGIHKALTKEVWDGDRKTHIQMGKRLPCY